MVVVNVVDAPIGVLPRFIKVEELATRKGTTPEGICRNVADILITMEDNVVLLKESSS